MRFYFDFEDGARATRDVDGQELDDVEAVRAELLRALPEVVLSEPKGYDERRVACSVRDSRGEVVYRASLTLAVTRLPNR